MPKRWLNVLSIVAALTLLAAACGSDGDSAASTTSEGPTPTTTVGADTSDATTETSTPTTSATTAPSSESSEITVYFSTGDGTDCGEVSPFTRMITAGDPPLEAALVALVAGPTPEEIDAGASSFFSNRTAKVLHAVEMRSGGLVVIGFNDLRPLIPNASTSCGSEALLAQLNSTTLQFTERVRYEMLDSCPIFAEWLQRECTEFTTDGPAPVALTTSERASGSGCTPAAGLSNGRWFGEVISATDSQIGFDLACWFDGDAANDAAAEDGEESPPPNDYYVRNTNDLIRTIPVTATTTVLWVPLIGDPASATEISFSEWVAEREARGTQLGVWLTVEGDRVVAIEEQWVP